MYKDVSLLEEGSTLEEKRVKDEAVTKGTENELVAKIFKEAQRHDLCRCQIHLECFLESQEQVTALENILKQRVHSPGRAVELKFIGGTCYRIYLSTDQYLRRRQIEQRIAIALGSVSAVWFLYTVWL